MACHKPLPCGLGLNQAVIESCVYSSERYQNFLAIIVNSIKIIACRSQQPPPSVTKQQQQNNNKIKEEKTNTNNNSAALPENSSPEKTGEAVVRKTPLTKDDIAKMNLKKKTRKRTRKFEIGKLNFQFKIPPLDSNYLKVN